MTNTRNRKPAGCKRKQKTVSGSLSARSSPEPDLPVAADDAPPSKVPPAGVLQKKPRTPKRERIGDALRRRGLDEGSIADGYVDVVGKLSNKSNGDDGVQKLLVDVLKECSRHLEPPRTEASPDAPVIVKLIHNVSRPARGPGKSS